jgi:hypothetical protein
MLFQIRIKTNAEQNIDVESDILKSISRKLAVFYCRYLLTRRNLKRLVTEKKQKQGRDNPAFGPHTVTVKNGEKDFF